MNAFVLHSVAKDVQLSTIFRGLVPFVLMDMVRIALRIGIPSLVLLLPSRM